MTPDRETPTRYLRSVLLDMGPYWWHYETAEIRDNNDGSITIRAVDGCVPRIIPKPTDPERPTA